MFPSDRNPSLSSEQTEFRPSAEGHALSRRQKFRLVVKVVELRLRFIALMVATGLVFAYWDTLWNYYDKWTRPAGEQVAAASEIEYYCPMHPSVVRDTPGNCPICGMPLSKRKKGQKEELPEGVVSRVQLAPFRIAQAGIRTTEASYAPLSDSLTTVGFVVFDERRLARISSKLKGMSRVEKLVVNFTNTEVKADEPLAEVYSPELYQAIKELLIARRSSRDLERSPRTTPDTMVNLVSLARQKLILWGITPGQIDAMLADERGAEHAARRVPILSPINGVVVRKNVVEGQYFAEGEPLFEIADLSHVWIQAQVYEDQLALVRVGQRVEATVEAYPGRIFKGTVAFLDPVLDPATRTVNVRYDLENPDGRLRPGMFATVTLKTPIAETPAFRARLASAKTSGTRPSHVESMTVDQQKICPVTKAKLGSMGGPISVQLATRKVWVCCPACPDKLKSDPARYLARLEPQPVDGVLSVPESAVIDTGDRQLVYVEAEPGVFEGRQVVLGPRTGDRFAVLDGLSAGDKVAAAGAFLIDAESRLTQGSTSSETTPAIADTGTHGASGTVGLHHH